MSLSKCVLYTVFVLGWECPQRFNTWLKVTDIPLRVTSFYSLDVACSILPFFPKSLPSPTTQHRVRNATPFENPLYFWLRKGGLGGSTSQNLSDLKFIFLETFWYREWDQGDC